jgi:rare lipoprotein A
LTGDSGKCSWYGGKAFEGTKTSCGVIYHDNELTAASNTYPCNTMLHVTANGHTITVKVTNTGGFGPGVILDLSKGSAERLNMITQGIAQCTVVKASIIWQIYILINF